MTLPSGPQGVIDALATRGLLALVDDVCRRRGVMPLELCGTRRTRAVASARHELWLLIREHPHRCYSCSEIAGFFACDPSTVLQGIAASRRRPPPGL